MSRTTYYTLVASLPRLPHFEEAAWLPMSRKQMNQRLTMLTPEDALQLRLADDLSSRQYTTREIPSACSIPPMSGRCI